MADNNNRFNQDEKNKEELKNNNVNYKEIEDNEVDFSDTMDDDSGLTLREKVLQSMSQHATEDNFYHVKVEDEGQKELHNGDSDESEEKVPIKNSVEKIQPKKETKGPTLEEQLENSSLKDHFVIVSKDEELEEPLALEQEVEWEPKETSEETQSEVLGSRKTAVQMKKENRQKENSMVRKIVTVVVVALLVCVTIFGLSVYKYVKTGLEPLNKKDDKLVQVEIPIGTSNKGIGAILEKDKVIKSGLIFKYYVKVNNLTDFQGGYYQMSPNMTLDEIATMLQNGGTAEPEALADAKITIPEGYSVEQVADLFAKKTNYTKDEFLNVMKDEIFFNQLYEKYPELLQSTKDSEGVRYRLEGYLFPATYNYYKESTLQDMVEQMVAKTFNVYSLYLQRINEEQRTMQQILTLASLVEKEGVSDSDRRKIAQVFYNRLEADMPLQSDISILYAMNEHKVHLSDKDTQIDSPYNLYINKGFGPGPFNNPSQKAVDAVLNPEPNDNLYFLADVTDNKVYFAETYEQHLELKAKYIDNKED